MTGKLRSSQFLRVWFPKCDIIQEIDEKLLYHEKTKKRALLAILFQIHRTSKSCLPHNATLMAISMSGTFFMRHT